jgi:integrase
MARRRTRKRANGEGSVYPRSDGRWAGELTVGFNAAGKQIRATVYGRTQAEARAKLEELKQRASQGLNIKPERLTVGKFLERWLASKACQPHVSFKTEEAYRDQVRVHIIPAIGHIELTKLTPEHVQQMVNALLAKPKRSGKNESEVEGAVKPTGNQETLSPRTVKHCRDTLRAALNVAMKWNLIGRNPAAQVSIKQKRRRATIYDETQAAAFLEAIYGERLEALYWLALCLGPREGEILGLKWTDFDFAAGKVQLIRALQRVKRPGEKKSRLEEVDTKTSDSDRSVRLPQIAIEKVLAHQRRQEEERAFAGSAWIESGMVFTTRKGTPLQPRNMLRDFYRIRNRAKLPRIRFHDLRHSAATILKMAGVPDEAIQNLLGHASPRTTQDIYSHVTPKGQKLAAAKMDEIFGPVAVTVAVKHAQKKPN